MSLSFLLDEDVSHRIAVGLRERGIDARSVHELRRNGLADEEQLRFATAQGRVLVTYNRADFQAIDAEWRVQGRPHAGILWCSEETFPRRSIGDLIHAIEAEAEAHDSLEELCLPLVRSAD